MTARPRPPPTRAVAARFTAGTKGVGAAVVDVLRNAGAIVVATARAIPADAPTGVNYIAADMTTAAGCATVAQGVLDRFGGMTFS